MQVDQTISPVLSSLATDIVDEKLELAKKFGADVLINGLKEDLKTAGRSGKQTIPQRYAFGGNFVEG